MTTVSARQQLSGRSCYKGPAKRDASVCEGLPRRPLRSPHSLRLRLSAHHLSLGLGRFCTWEKDVILYLDLGDEAFP